MDITVLLTKLLLFLTLSFILNVPLGMWRSKTRKFSFNWFIAIHLAVPLIYFLRVTNNFAAWTILFFVAAAVLGQMVGGSVAKSLAKKKTIFVSR